MEAVGTTEASPTKILMPKTTAIINSQRRRDKNQTRRTRLGKRSCSGAAWRVISADDVFAPACSAEAGIVAGFSNNSSESINKEGESYSWRQDGNAQSGEYLHEADYWT